MHLLRSVYTTASDLLLRLNLFNSRSADERIIRREILSTRLFLALFSISIVILIVYTSISVQIKHETVNKPSLLMYRQLQMNYPDTLQCPCEKISVQNGKFVSVTPSFHQVCFSDFVSQLWIDFTFDINKTSIWPIDVRNTLSSMWRLMNILCQTSMNNLNNALEQYSHSSLVNSMLLPEPLLKAKVEANLALLQRTTAGNLIRPLIQELRLIQANEFISGLSLNYVAVTEYFGRLLTSLHIDDISVYVGIVGNIYLVNGTRTTCSCKNNRSCPLPGHIYARQAYEKYGLYDLNTMDVHFTVPGIVIDCIPLKSVLASSLECFYDQSCLNNLVLAYSKTLNISILNSSLTSRFHPATKIEELINDLFVEQIANETIYDSYYLDCSPVYCSYIYTLRFDLVNVINTLIALVGGLNIALHFAAPIIIDVFFIVKHRLLSRNNKVASISDARSQPVHMHSTHLFHKIKRIIVELNLFPKAARRPDHMHRGRITTRLYLLLISVSIGILIFYSTLSIQTYSQRIESPTQEQYQILFDRYDDQLKCPCATISIEYDEFIELSPIFHQICSSDFIHPWWYQSLVPSNASDMLFEFITVASSYFQSLSTFCEIANMTVIDAFRQFYSTEFVNTDLLSQDRFKSQVNTIIETFLHNTKIDFLYTTSVIQNMLQANQYVSSTRLNTELYRSYMPQLEESLLGPLRVISITTGALDENDDWCFCVLSSTCDFTGMFYVNGEVLNIFSQLPGLYPDCFVVQSALKSSLLCWYNQSCIDAFHVVSETYGIGSNAQVNPLDLSRSSRYPIDTSVGTIFNEIMIESWHVSVYYERFYRKCQPVYCSYTYQEPSTIIYVITTVIGLCGGLNVVFRLISPFIVSTVFACKAARRLPESTQAWTTHEQTNSCSILLNYLRSKLASLNLFDTESQDEQAIRYQRLSTQLYLSLLIITIFTLTVYHCSARQSNIISIPNATQYDYERLLASHSKTLQCPCTHHVIPYQRFISINSSLHQVCSSEFVGKLWHQCLFAEYSWREQDRIDLRGRGTSYFVLLSTMCTLAQTTIDKATHEFLGDAFINTWIISEFEFHARMNILLDQFKRLTAAKFAHTIRMIHEINEGNALVSSFFLNWFWHMTYNSSIATIPIQAVVMDYQCSCGTRSDCVEPGGFTFPFSSTLEFAVPGWNIGCSVTDTLFRSTLECFYDQTCVDLVLHYAIDYLLDGDHFYQYLNISAMDIALESRFPANTLIGDIADQLFIEEWHINVSYASYFAECSLAYCSYVQSTPNSIPYIIAQILGLYGGLTIALRFSAPRIITVALFVKARLVRTPASR